jgi:serine/threonine protein kinase
MKQVCLICERTSADHNLYCQDVRCQAELSPFVLDYGERLGDIEIVKALIIQRTAVLYVAQRAGKQIYLKVAHPGIAHTERLKREAQILNTLRRERALGPHLPSLLPPTIDTALEISPYSKIVIGQHLLYYYVFAYLPGEPLCDILKKTPQLWVNHVGRIALGMASALTVLQSKGLLHLGISPSSVLVHFDPRTREPQVLLVDLGLVCGPPAVAQTHYPDFSTPAYAPPELLSPAPSQPSYASDVYGLGLTLYEMLVGEPAIATRQRSDDEIKDAVRQGRLVPMTREDDVKPIADIALGAVVERRTESAQAFAQQLMTFFKQAPRQRRGTRLTIEVMLVLVVVLLLAAFLIALIVSFSPQIAINVLPPGLPLWSNLYA